MRSSQVRDKEPADWNPAEKQSELRGKGGAWSEPSVRGRHYNRRRLYWRLVLSERWGPGRKSSAWSSVTCSSRLMIILGPIPEFFTRLSRQMFPDSSDSGSAGFFTHSVWPGCNCDCDLGGIYYRVGTDVRVLRNSNRIRPLIR